MVLKSSGLSCRAIVYLLLWYFFSFTTLMLNKYALTTLHGDPTLVGAAQMLGTTICGFIQMYLPCGLYTPTEREGRPQHFFRNMLIVGSTRFATVMLSLVALKYVAVSFTETIKSSAPMFTVIISRILLGERTSLVVLLSLVPIMSGLVICSAYEISFNVQGFIAAVATNMTECLQNVYSKLLLSGEKYKYTPAELQFFTSAASIIVQLPASYFLMDIPYTRKTMDQDMVIALFLNGLSFHCQSITAYALMHLISPVTHSVANTVKRAIMIWLSVLIIGNSVTLLSGIGTIIVTLGVMCYIKARDMEHKRKESITVKTHESVV